MPASRTSIRNLAPPAFPRIRPVTQDRTGSGGPTDRGRSARLPGEDLAPLPEVPNAPVEALVRTVPRVIGSALRNASPPWTSCEPGAQASER